jgi:hypothetical protein
MGYKFAAENVERATPLQPEAARPWLNSAQLSSRISGESRGPASPRELKALDLVVRLDDDLIAGTSAARIIPISTRCSNDRCSSTASSHRAANRPRSLVAERCPHASEALIGRPLACGRTRLRG